MIAGALKNAAVVAESRGVTLVLTPFGIQIEASDIVDGEVRQYDKIVSWSDLESAIDPSILLDHEIEVAVVSVEVGS